MNNRPKSAAQDTRFIILATPRTGSTWLVDQLHKPPESVCYSEMFLPGAGKDFPTAAGARDVMLWASYLRERGVAAHRSPTELRRYLKQLYSQEEPVKSVGVKVMYRDVRTNPILLPLLRTMGSRVVHLRRANLLDVAISQAARADGQNIAHIRANSGEHFQAPVCLDSSSLLEFLDRLEQRSQQMGRLLKTFRFQTAEVNYEDLVAGNSWDAISKLLGVSLTIRSSSLSKLSSGERRDRVSNWEEVVGVLSGTTHEKFL
ncbi:MAG: hypothetical protein R8J94_05020 [Acidimicrobiia bacterium]|nr:hypothetical protein [Acidimicrobiia bacterium]